MPHDFSQLSDKDFENICRDLLQIEMGVKLETFKSGRDQGIDIRYLGTDEDAIYIQCKHYLISGLQKLISNLKKTEINKVRELNPNRYIICTSIPLNRNNKITIKQIFEPFIKSETDIYGQEDLNNLLNRHPEIETQHYKLWFSSTNIFNRVLNNAIQVRSEILVKKIHRKIPIYVQGPNFSKVRSILDNEHIALISGEPGVGKTTLAEMIIYKFLSEDFTLIDVQNAKDAFDLYNPEKKTLFFFDDFLGLTFLGDNFNEKDSTEILKLIDLIKNSDNAYMILTSRDYILHQAEMESERLSNHDFLNTKHKIQLSTYTQEMKAQILYNHLFFSKLDPEYIHEIIITETYKPIISHTNYSPRIIEWMTNKTFMNEVSIDAYPSYFLQSLDRPKRLWQIPFQKQISSPARHLLLVLFSMGTDTNCDYVKNAFNIFHKGSCKKYGYQIHPTDYNSAIKELLDSFLNLALGEYTFINPSVKDFLELWIFENPDILEDFFDNAVYFNQIQYIFKLCNSQSKFSNYIPNFKSNIIQSLIRIKETRGESHCWEFEHTHFYLTMYLEFRNVDILNIFNELLQDSLNSYQHLIKKDLTIWIDIGQIVFNEQKNDSNLLPALNSIQQIIISSINEAKYLDDYSLLVKALKSNLLENKFKNEIKEKFLETYLKRILRSEKDEIPTTVKLEDFEGNLIDIIDYFNIKDTDYYFYDLEELYSDLSIEEEIKSKKERHEYELEYYYNHQPENIFPIDEYFSSLFNGEIHEKNNT